MTPQDLAATLLREDFLQELHHLLWIEPQYNNGRRDEGWNCRDHALIVAGVAQMLGFKAAIHHGRASFVQGRRGEVIPLWMDTAPHAWVGIQGAGHYDLSLRLSKVSMGEQRLDWNVVALAADQMVSPEPVRVVWTYEEKDYERAISQAMQLEDTNSVIYNCGDIVELTAESIRAGLETCYSPLTDWLRAEFGGRQDLHARAILHLLDLLQGRGSSLVAMSRDDAWRSLVKRPGDAVWRVCSRGGLA